MGKEKHTWDFIFSVNRAVHKFYEDEPFANKPYSMVFGCDKGDHMSWLNELNSEVQNIKYKSSSNLLGRGKS